MLRSPWTLIIAVAMMASVLHTHRSFAAAGETLTVKGYYFEISADRLGGELRVRGAVSGGVSCKKLIIDLYLRSEEGDREHLVAIVNDYGSVARFDVKESRIGKGRRWKVSKLKVRAYQ